MAYSAKQRKYNVSIEGAKELAKELREMEEGAKSVLIKAVTAGGQIALNDAKANCPVKTGKLKNSLKIAIKKESETRADLQLDYDKTLYYGTFVELGVKGRKPHPFLRNSIDNNVREINQAVVDTVAKELK